LLKAIHERSKIFVLTPTTSTADAPWNAQRRLTAETTLLALRIDSSEASDSIEIRARRPDGSIEPLLLTREFADQWQTPYVLGRPLTLPAGRSSKRRRASRGGY
jgi:hypothetical protein